ncbi:hypothetical protein B0H14DRAFT_3470405 [Mycena olivaceomarginata]|nr:hypothetical protein B0H14DRAFT_3470405 [Mycena olivaceomarginata]
MRSSSRANLGVEKEGRTKGWWDAPRPLYISIRARPCMPLDTLGSALWPPSTRPSHLRARRLRDSYGVTIGLSSPARSTPPSACSPPLPPLAPTPPTGCLKNAPSTTARCVPASATWRANESALLGSPRLRR